MLGDKMSAGDANVVMNARERALTAAGLGEYLCVPRWAPGASDLPKAIELDKNFVEVPSRLLRSGLWHVEAAGQWQRDEGIVHLEARAALYGIQRQLNLQSGQSGHFVLLVDNIAFALIFSRLRSRDFGLLNILRKAEALLLARNAEVHIR